METHDLNMRMVEKVLKYKATRFGDLKKYVPYRITSMSHRVTRIGTAIFLILERNGEEFRVFLPDMFSSSITSEDINLFADKRGTMIIREHPELKIFIPYFMHPTFPAESQEPHALKKHPN